MKSLNGYLKKILLFISLFSLFFLHFKTDTLAQDSQFLVNSYFVHTINTDSVDTKITIQLTTETTRVLSIYTATIQAKNISPKCYINKTEEVQCDRYNRTSVTDIQFGFNNKVITPENPFEIIITYTTPHSNEISYNLPSKVLDTNTKEVIVKYPKGKGEFSWASENIQNKGQEGNLYTITFQKPQNPEISLFFTKDIQYKFVVNRVFSNPTEQVQTFELILPMDSEFQKVLWKEINPMPSFSTIDEDGNYIFSYMVEANKTIDCHITGFIQKETSTNTTQPKDFLTKNTGYWEITDTTEIQRVHSFLKDKGLEIHPDITDISLLSEKQKEIFYKYLYQYVIYRLDYKKNIKLGQVESPRTDIPSIIKNSSSLSALDFANFYIALLRHFSIPSRMVLGYISNISGYTTDGYYHYWVEYYDDTKQQWVSVDPFMEEYRKQNLFGNDFADHIAIIRRGKNPMTPTLTFYTPNDFLVTLENKDIQEKRLIINKSFSLEDYDITKKYLKGYINLSNSGNIAISDIRLEKSSLGKISQYIDSTSNTTSTLLLPGQNHNIQLNLPFEKINSNEIMIAGKVSNISGVSEDIVLKTKIPNGIPTYVIILSKVLSFIVFSVIILFSYVIFKSIKKYKWTQQV